MVFSMTDNKKERYELAKGRICEIGEECVKGDAYSLYFRKTASFLQDIMQTYEEAQSGELYKAAMETLQEKNRKLYEDILPENYEGKLWESGVCREGIRGRIRTAFVLFIYGIAEHDFFCLREGFI